MRLTALVVALILGIHGSAAAQEWDLFTSIPDGFSINFPGQPRITQTTWTSQLDFTLPAKTFSADKGNEHYSVTVVDYSGIEQMGVERAKTCPPGNANCRANAPPALGAGYAQCVRVLRRGSHALRVGCAVRPRAGSDVHSRNAENRR